MTRKQYINKGQHLILAIYKNPNSRYLAGHKIGESLKYYKSHAREAAVRFGSYEAAWNNDAMRWAREYYLLNNLKFDAYSFPCGLMFSAREFCVGRITENSLHVMRHSL